MGRKQMTQREQLEQKLSRAADKRELEEEAWILIRCARCGCKLRRDNPGPHCLPCSHVKVEE